MNMTSVLHRHGAQTPTMPGIDPAAPHSGGRTSQPGPWPPGARVIVAVLVLATVISTIAAVLGFSRDDDAEQAALRERIAELTEARADALDRVADLDTELATLQDQLDAAIAGGDTLSDRVVALEGDIAELTSLRADALERVEELTATVAGQAADLDDLGERIELTIAEREDLRERLALAIAERDELADRFPFGFDVSLVGIDMAGTYKVKVTDVVGTTPKFTELTITRTKEGWLTVKAPGLADGGFTMVDGVLQMVAGSSTAAGSCHGVARQATVVMTLVPSGYQVGTNGARPTGFDAVVSTIAPATGSCGAFVSIADATLSR